MTLSSQQYANLADHSYGRDQQGNTVDLAALVGKPTVIEGVKYKVLAHADRPSGYQGTVYQWVDTGEIVVAHRGTEFDREPIADGLLADGGMVFGRVNSQARDAIELTREALQEAQKFASEKGTSPPEVTVTGHSLGGTLAQITAHHFDLRGETFNAYGAVSLGYRIPEGGERVLNHVLAADVVSAASPHYGQMRHYARPGEIAQLHATGYNNVPLAGRLVPHSVVAASINSSHMMHNFLDVDGEGRPDVSILRDASARTRAEQNARMIGHYRDDVRAVRAGASLGGDAVDVLRYGPALAPQRALGRAAEALQPDLPPGAPARLEAGAAPRRRAPQQADADVPTLDTVRVTASRPRQAHEPAHPAPAMPGRPLLTDPGHPNHALYAAIAERLPEGTDPKVAANVTREALAQGIGAPQQLAGVAVRGNDVFVMGTVPGFRAQVDLSAPTSDLQTMSDQMARQAHQQSQTHLQPHPQMAR